MDVKELQNIMVEYGKIKSIKVIHYQNGGTEKNGMTYYETEIKYKLMRNKAHKKEKLKKMTEKTNQEQR